MAKKTKDPVVENNESEETTEVSAEEAAVVLTVAEEKVDTVGNGLIVVIDEYGQEREGKFVIKGNKQFLECTNKDGSVNLLHQDEGGTWKV